MTLKEAYTYLGLFPMPFKLFRIIIHELKEQFQAGDMHDAIIKIFQT